MPPSRQILVVGSETARATAEVAISRMDAITIDDLGENPEIVRNRAVVIWPENGEEGWREATRAATWAFSTGAIEVKLIEPPGRARHDGWDIVDVRAEGLDPIEWAKPRIRVLRDGEMGNQPRAAMITIEQPEPEPAPPEPAPSKPRRRTSNVIALPNAPAELRQSGDAFLSECVLDDHDRPKPKVMRNFIAAIQHHSSLQGVFRFDDFRQSIAVVRAPPWAKTDTWIPRPISDDDITRTQSHLEYIGLTPKHGEAGIALFSAAQAVRFDPARDYLNSLKWDGTPRVQGGMGLAPWLVEYLGVRATNAQIERAFGMRWLIAGAARILSERPDGEKVDNMLILEGEQGKMKSTALEILATWGGNRYFTDNVEDIKSKDAVLQMQGNVIIEIAELDALNKAEVESVKKWLSRKVDSIRLPYGRTVVNLPRKAIIAGTVNPSGTGYLKDATGGRRFWPVTVTGDIDLARLTADRDQLWAEAAHLYRQGEPWWLQGGEIEAAQFVQAARYQEDAWGEAINLVLPEMPTITMHDIFNKIGLPVAQRDGRAQARIAAHLKAHGYFSKVQRISGRPVRVYHERVMTDAQQ